MFTVKHVHDSGNETIHLATEVNYAPVGAGSHSIGTVWCTRPATGHLLLGTSAEIHGLEGGTVYVMNDQGRTVATYRMSMGVEYGSGANTLNQSRPPV